MKKWWKNITTSRGRVRRFLKRFKQNNIRKSKAKKWETVKYNKIQKLFTMLLVKLLNDNTKIRSEPIYKSKQNETKGTGLEIVTPK